MHVRALLLVTLAMLGLTATARAQVTPIPVPAAEGSGMYTLAVSSEGRPYLSWIDTEPSGGHALRFSTLDGGAWSAPRLIARGADWFVNWADHPSIMPLRDGHLAAHWLVNSPRAQGKYGYGIRAAHSTDGGVTWRTVLEDNLDKESDYSGFLSFLAEDTGFSAVFLKPHAKATAESHIKTLAFARFSGDGGVRVNEVVDQDVCSCCGTSVARTALGPVAVYRDHEPGEIRDISVIRFVDGRWTSPRPVHRDGWEINGCPTNGPVVAADGRRVAVAWFTGAGGQARVKVAFSNDAAGQFSAPVVVDGGQPIGWPGLVLLEDGSVVVSWLESIGGGHGEIRLRRVQADGRMGDARVVAAARAGRTTGIPKLARAGRELLVAWRGDRIMTALVPVPDVVEPRSQEPTASPAARPVDRAQTPPPVTETITVVGKRPSDTLSLDEATATGSRLGLTPRQTPATVVVVDRHTLEERGATDTQEILNSVPGLTAAAPPGSAGSVTYRGFGAAQLTQLFNGITVQYDAIAARPVDSWIYDRVEVIGGPSTFLFGAGAVGGSINYVTKLATTGRNAVDARVSLGSHGSVELAGGLNRRLTTGTWQNHVRVDVSRTGTEGFVDGNERRAWTAAASWRTDVGRRLSHSLAIERQDEQSDRPYWGTPLLNPTTGDGRIDPATRFTNYNSRDGVYEQGVFWGRSILEYRPAATVSIRNTVYHYDARRDYRNVEVYRYNAANTAVVRSAALLQRHDQTLTGDRVEAQFRTAFAGIDSSWAAGFDVSVNEQTRFPRSLPATVSTVDPADLHHRGLLRGARHGARLQPGPPQRRLDRGLLHREPDPAPAAPVARHRPAPRSDRISRSPTSAPSRRPIPRASTGCIARRPAALGLTYSLSPSANVYGTVQHGGRSARRHPDDRELRPVARLRSDDRAAGRGGHQVRHPRWPWGGHGRRLPDRPQEPRDSGSRQSDGHAAGRPAVVAGRRACGGPCARRAACGSRVTSPSSMRSSTTSTRTLAAWRSPAPATRPRTRLAPWRICGPPTPSARAGSSASISRMSRRGSGTPPTPLAIPATPWWALSPRTGFRPGVTVVARGRNLTDTVYARSITGTPMFFLGAPRTVEVSLRVGL